MGSGVSKFHEPFDLESVKHLSQERLRQLHDDVACHVAYLEAKNVTLMHRVQELEQHAKQLHGPQEVMEATYDERKIGNCDEFKLLPEGLRGFKTISSFEELHNTGEQLSQCSQAVLYAPDDQQVTDALHSAAQLHIRALEQAISSRLEETGIVEQCDKAIEVGMHDFREVYDVIWNRIERRADDIEPYISIAKIVVEDVRKRKVGDILQQRTEDPVELLRDAAKTKPKFDAFIAQLSTFRGNNRDCQVVAPASNVLEPVSAEAVTQKTVSAPERILETPQIPCSHRMVATTHTPPSPPAAHAPLFLARRPSSNLYEEMNEAELEAEGGNLVEEGNASQVNDALKNNRLPFKIKIPSNLKKITRICEKACLRRDCPGSAARIFDVCRCMVEVTSMAHAGLVLKLLHHKADEIEIVRVKERFVQSPSPGGWRDCLVNFYFVEDAAKHVVEVQIVHREMIVARKDLSGHAIYNVVRNAHEILERIGVGVKDGRPGRLAKMNKDQEIALRRSNNVGHFRRIGVSLGDMIEARCFDAKELREDGNYTAQELVDSGINFSALLCAGYSARDLRAANASDPGALLAADYPKSEVFAAFGIERQVDIDRAVLMHLFHITGRSMTLTNWGSVSRGISEWHGVSVNDYGHVVSLNLANCGLRGRIPRTIGLLKHLHALDLSLNSELIGELPRELSHLHRLNFLNLANCPVSLPGSGAEIISVGLDPRRESRVRVEELFAFLHFVDLGLAAFETKRSIGILWNALVVAAVVGQAKDLGVQASWVACGIGFDRLPAPTVQPKQEATLKSQLALATENKKRVGTFHIRFAGPAPWFFEKSNMTKSRTPTLAPFDPELGAKLEAAFKAGCHTIQLERGYRPETGTFDCLYEYDLRRSESMTQTRLLFHQTTTLPCETSALSTTSEPAPRFVRGRTRAVRRVSPLQCRARISHVSKCPRPASAASFPPESAAPAFSQRDSLRLRDASSTSL